MSLLVGNTSQIPKSKKFNKIFQIGFNKCGTTGKKPKILSIDELNWSETEKKIHLDICLETLKLMDYSLDKNYFIK
jgi:hypothetical protein